MKSEQNSNERKAELFRKTGVDEVGGASAVPLRKFEVGHLHGEYVNRDGDLLAHFFWREPPPDGSPAYRQVAQGFPAQDVYAPWPHNFRQQLWEAVLDRFHLRDEPKRVEIEWIDELSSWCVTVMGVCRVVTPPESVLIDISNTVLESIKQ